MTAEARKSWMRFAPAVVLLALFVIGLSTGLAGHVSLEGLRAHHETLHGYTRAYPILAAALFVAVFITAVASGLPVCLILTITGGSVFGPWIGASLTTVSATTGATATYLAARIAAGSWLHDWAERRGGAGKRIVEGFGRHAFGNMLTLRLIPFSPFTPLNVAAGVAGIPLRAFVAASFLGEIPSALIYARLGAGLGQALDSGANPTNPSILNLNIIIPLAGLALMAFLSTAIRIWWAWRTAAAKLSQKIPIAD
jgi:uncharacterized membrane protein YdjX (TVP38/TMEM64 family)